MNLVINEEYNVINRKGEKVPLDFNKILSRLTSLKNIKPELRVNVGLIAQNTIKRMVDGISTIELDNISSRYCAASITNHYDYGQMASRIEIDNLHRITNTDYLTTVNTIRDLVDILDTKLIKFAETYNDIINQVLNYSLDYKFTYFGIMTLKKAYLMKKISNNIILERPQHMFMRVSIGINLNKINEDGSTDKKTLNEIFKTYGLMSQGYYTHATPTLFNAGTKRQSLSSCFLLSVEDSIEGIYKTLTDTARISKWSGGIGIHTTQVRAKGSLIQGTNGKSEGLVPMLKMYNDSALYVSQGGGKRKGSTAVYLEPWHADIESFLDLKKPIGDEMLRARDLFLALWIPDLFMKRLEYAIKNNTTVMWSLFCPDRAKSLADVYGDEFNNLYKNYEKDKLYNKQVSITDLWKRILEIQMESGVPYLCFKDSVNIKSNQNNLGTIKSSNLCVAGDTMILTDEGYFRIKDLEGLQVQVWNGFEYSSTMPVKTGVNQKLITIEFSNGCFINCTPYHKFHIQKDKIVIVEAKDLKPGDELIKCSFPVIFGNDEDDICQPYTCGYYYGSNGYDKRIIAYSNKKLLDRELSYTSKNNSDDGYREYYLSNNIEEIYTAPLNASLQNKLTWLAGFIDACGNIANNRIYKCIQLTFVEYLLLFDVKLLCNTMGLNPKLKYDEDFDMYRLLFTSIDTYYLFCKLNIPTKIIKMKITSIPRHNHQRVRVTEKIELDGLHDTYCFNETKRHLGIFNGLISGQCAEICIYTDENNIGVCNLASLCLANFVESEPDSLDSNCTYNYKKLFDVTKIITRNLNKVIDNNVYPVVEGKHSDSLNRPIAIGVQALADVFFKFKIPFTSDKAKEINKLIFETIYYAAATASNELAKEYGPYKNFETSMSARGILQPDLWGVTPSDLWDWNLLRKNIEKTGLYNSLLVALMPTASTSQIMGNYEMFEPITSNMFIRNTLSGTFQIINKYLIDDLIKLGIWNDTIKQKIIAFDGSVQYIDEIPKDLKEVYKTVYEISAKELINMDADRNAYVCHSSSSNRYMKDPNFNKLTSMHMYSWKKGLKTGCYYLRTQSGANAVKFNVDAKILKEIQQKNNIERNDTDEEECLVCSA